MTKVCPYCGEANEDIYKFCVHCGKALGTTRTCPHCHETIPLNSQICPVCKQPIMPIHDSRLVSTTAPVQVTPTTQTPDSTKYIYDSYVKDQQQGSSILSNTLITLFGIILFIILLFLILWNIENLYLLFISILPGSLIIAYFRHLDKNKEPNILIGKVFLVGAFTTIIAYVMELVLLMAFFIIIGINYGDNPNILHSPIFLLTFIFYMSFFVAGFTEELMKYGAIKFIIKHPEFNEPYDGVFYGVVGAVGFATIENIMYVLQSTNPFLIGALRGLLSVPMHAITGGLIGYYVSQQKFGSTYINKKNVLNIIAIPILIHGTYDFVIFLAGSPMFTPYNGILIFLAMIFDAGLLIVSFLFLKRKINELELLETKQELTYTL